MIKKLLIAAVFINIIGLNLNAQTVPSPTEVTVNIEPVNEIVIPDEVLDTLTDPMSLLGPNDPLNLSVSMLLADTNTVTKLYIKLGTTLGGNDLLENTYTYDATPTGNLTYFREGAMMTLGMGSHLNLGIFYCEIKLEDSTGNLSEIITVQSDQ
jgi:hypothetical protein